MGGMLRHNDGAVGRRTRAETTLHRYTVESLNRFKDKKSSHDQCPNSKFCGFSVLCGQDFLSTSAASRLRVFAFIRLLERSNLRRGGLGRFRKGRFWR